MAVRVTSALTRAAVAVAWALLNSWVACAANASDAPVRPRFELRATDGRAITQASFPKQWKVVFFGFTNCPDICPLTLVTLQQAMRKLGGDASKVQPLFITVDPARDTPDVLSKYVAHFDARLTALTGGESQISAAAAEFRAPFYRYDDRRGSYQMSHSGLLYVLDPSGALIATIRNNTEASQLASELKALLSGTWVTSLPRAPLALSFKNAVGDGVDVTSMRGRVVLLHVWATWCLPCVQSLRSLDRLQARLGREHLEVVALAADRDIAAVDAAFRGASIESIKPFFGLTLTAMNELGIASLPATILVDAHGMELARLKGSADWEHAATLAPVLSAVGRSATGASVSTPRPIPSH